ncbi:MAG TPA: nitroreductase [Spirochaetota bacterium]|nr:nitroreductase [Spirochaetota bacterium]
METKFIRTITLMLTAATICVSLLACGGVRRGDIVRDTGAVPSQIPSHIYGILALAAYAPSGHNTQPWSVTITGNDSFDVGADRSRRLPGVDPTNRELMISMGAFLEAVARAAELRGYEARITVTAKSPDDESVATVKLTKTTTTPAFTEENLLARRIVRKDHCAKEISADDLTFLTQDLGGMCAFHPASSATGKMIAALTVEANRVQAYRDDAQAELARWIRFRDDDARKHRDGLTVAGMEISGISAFAVRHFFDADSVMENSFRERSVDMVKEQVSSYGGWLLITSKTSSAADLIDTGRRFFRMSLRTRHRMIVIHPMTQILEESRIKDEFVKSSGIKDEPQFILRVSYIESYPDPVSLRRAPEEFTKGVIH